MAHDPNKVPEEQADLFYHQTLDGTPPVGLEDDEYDKQKAEMQAAGTWPFDDHSDEEPGALGDYVEAGHPDFDLGDAEPVD